MDDTNQKHRGESNQRQLSDKIEPSDNNHERLPIRTFAISSDETDISHSFTNKKGSKKINRYDKYKNSEMKCDDSHGIVYGVASGVVRSYIKLIGYCISIYCTLLLRVCLLLSFTLDLIKYIQDVLCGKCTNGLSRLKSVTKKRTPCTFKCKNVSSCVDTDTSDSIGTNIDSLVSYGPITCCNKRSSDTKNKPKCSIYMLRNTKDEKIINNQLVEMMRSIVELLKSSQTEHEVIENNKKDSCEGIVVITTKDTPLFGVRNLTTVPVTTFVTTSTTNTTDTEGIIVSSNESNPESVNVVPDQNEKSM
ncbi:hypothetical protein YASMINEVIRUS_1288 [Yasminevirus sp. GU-2018]|uniref:Uncharacterized protein n=1 Tax=Yasminevirus sp. GU-2018 TaxID=2420051 RepID=A0A5K0UBZ5_9VIRU|nr:hypothetical protein YASMINEVIRUS_1288 [Yasminevirus sp. GU-2018]